MNKRLPLASLVLVLMLWLPIPTYAQSSTYDFVYNIFERKCNSCHSTASPVGGLDLEGSGATVAAKQADVYAKIFSQSPGNAYASGQNYKLIDPGNAWRSYIFRKINAGLQPNMVLDAAEGDPHDNSQLHTITDLEKEAIRQWIFQAAPQTGNVVDIPLLQQYYAGNAVPSFTTPPPAPDPAEGFQVQLGPFFLAPEGEIEYFWKYATQLKQDIEVNKIEVLFGNYSHHHILYKYRPNTQQIKNEGLRLDPAHEYTSLVSAQQFADTITLPKGSAFFWEANTYLDFNTHYINYSRDKVAGCEVYLNIYTQPKGTARQEMKSELIPNTSIYIPNDSVKHTFQASFFDSRLPVNIYLWGLTSHTHQWGVDFDVFTRNTDGTRDDHIFDAEYKDGDPNGLFRGYDYQHPPIRYFHDFLPVRLDRGVIYEASWINKGAAPVRWGDTSDDEMMVLLFFYLEDTAGVQTGPPTSVAETRSSMLSMVPNPASGLIKLYAPDAVGAIQFTLMDQNGREVLQENLEQNGKWVNVKHLPKGLYFYRLENSKGEVRMEKVLLR
ncbi:MAG: T9SS type A sorting domain-containing protein [Bacteroidota bacterium]